MPVFTERLGDSVDSLGGGYECSVMEEKRINVTAAIVALKVAAVT